MLFKILAFVALAVAATASPAPTAWSWNELVGAENLFHPEIDAIQSKSIEPTVLVSELTELLGQPKVLAAVYKTYMTQYEKEESRMFDPQPQTNFKRTLIEIAEHNLGAKLGQYSWFEGVNQFTDMSAAEYQQFLTYTISFEDYYKNSSIPQRRRETAPKSPTQEDSVDWVAKGVVTKVKDQGRCGSCYAFSSIGQLESCALIQGYSNNPELDLSEQQVVDCSTKVGNKGCNGGGLTRTDEFLKAGAALEADYGGYKGKQGSCKKNIASAPPKVETATRIQDENELKEAVAQRPVSVAVDANCRGFQNYKTGVLSDCTQKINHAVMAVGFGNANGKDMWLVKNSWGTTWGDKGYIKIQRGDNTNIAGIGKDASTITCSIE